MQNIKEYLSYNPDTGVFTWLKNTGKLHKIGEVAGHTALNGYVYVQYKSKRYLAHRLAWYFIYGSVPEKEIDHINEQRHDNRVCNLREVSRPQNAQNKSRYVGASWVGSRNKWQVYITTNSKTKFIGYFDNKEDAQDAYLAAKRKHHTFWVENK
jgi:hypothetical protein